MCVCAGAETQASGATAAGPVGSVGGKYVPPNQRGGERSRGSGEMLGGSRMSRDGKNGVSVGCG